LTTLETLTIFKSVQRRVDEKYLAAKQNLLDDYPIFMAIAEHIGNDATGWATGKKELTEISEELVKFISHIHQNEV
jgi:type I restriction enzyme M protein